MQDPSLSRVKNHENHKYNLRSNKNKNNTQISRVHPSKNQYNLNIHQIQQPYIAPVIHSSSQNPLEYKQLIKTQDKHIWVNSFTNEFSILEQGFDSSHPKGTNTILFISYQNIPQKKTSHV